MERFRHWCGWIAAASVTVHLVVLTTAVSGSLADPTSTSKRDFPPVSTNRCSDFDLSGFTNAMNCGSSLSAPCFDSSRCRDSPPTVYIYDREVGDVEVFPCLFDPHLPNVVGKNKSRHGFSMPNVGHLHFLVPNPPMSSYRTHSRSVRRWPEGQVAGYCVQP